MRFQIPHAFALLVGCVIFAAALTWVVPAGEFTRQADPATGRRAVVPGSYHAVAPNPVGPFRALVAIPRGMASASSVIFLVFLAGGAFAVVDSTGAFKQGVLWLVHKFRHRTELILIIGCAVFALLGAVEGMWEEFVALVPVLLLLARSAGFDPLTAVAMSRRAH
jgi:uncharacterized ion transporter superfamily protein YfcC